MESLRLWEISPTIPAAIPAWPGGTPLRAILREPALKDTA